MDNMDKVDKGSLSGQVRLWVDENKGRRFALHVLDNEIGIYDSLDKNNRWHLVQRMIKEGLVAKDGGYYRVIGNGCTPIDWQAANENLVKSLKFPFGLEQYIKILPKNIIIIAGAKDAGKTAFLLNFVLLNMANHTINYFSSEMGDLEFRGRLIEFENTELAALEEWKFNAFERAFDFQDVIRPDEINVIDFLEVHEDFWKVGGLIFQIWDKLRDGVAVIALQKNPDIDLGLGGARSLEKARLYLAMDNNRAKIIVGKNWAQKGVNPKGKSWSFKLIGGAKFVNVRETA